MFLASLRYRMPSQETWTFLRFPTGHGELKNVHVVTTEVFELFHEILSYVLLGQRTLQPHFEAVIQFHDTDGSSWSLFRKPGSLRITKDGETTDTGESLHEILRKAVGHALSLDENEYKNHLYHAYHGIFENKNIEAWHYGQAQPAHLGIRRIISEKIDEIHADIFVSLGVTAKKSSQMIVDFTQELAMLQGRLSFMIAEKAHWSEHQVGSAGQDTQTALENQVVTLKSAKELGIMAEIQRLVAPLCGPHTMPLQTMEKQRFEWDQQIEALEKILGGSSVEKDVPDFDKALECLCRLQAYGKLVKATRDLREYCDNQLDPQLKSYIAHAETIGSDFRKLLEEIQAEQLFVQQQKEIFMPRMDVQKDQEAEQEGRHGMGKTWFDRLKGPTKSFQNSPSAQQTSHERENFYEFIRKVSQTVDTIVGKGVQLLEELPVVDGQHRELSSSLESSLYGLAQRYAKAREEWAEMAKKFHLSPEMDVAGLVKLSIVYSRLTMMKERRQWLESRITDQRERIQKLEKLIISWRKLTDSQKTDPLDHPQLVIHEALSITRYMDNKIRRFDQLKEKFSEQSLKSQALQFVQGYLDDESQNLMRQWQGLFQSFGVMCLPPDHSKIPEFVEAGEKIKHLLQLLESFRHSVDDCRKPALLEAFCLRQRFSEQTMDGLIGWLKVEADIKNPFRSLVIVTDHEPLMKSLVAQGASLGVLTTRSGAQQQSPVTRINQDTVPVDRLSDRMIEGTEASLKDRATLATLSLKPTPTIKKNQLGQSQQKNTPPARDSAQESLQVRAERVLAMLNPRDTTKLSR